MPENENNLSPHDLNWLENIKEDVESILGSDFTP